MVIYDSENGKLYVPGKTDQVYIVTPEDIYQQGYDEGYKAGMSQAAEDCHNNNVTVN